MSEHLNNLVFDGWPIIAFSWQLWELRELYRTAHFITFTCYHRYPHLAAPAVRDLFVQALERTRGLYRMRVYGFVFMPGAPGSRPAFGR